VSRERAPRCGRKAAEAAQAGGRDGNVTWRRGHAPAKRNRGQPAAAAGPTQRRRQDRAPGYGTRRPAASASSPSSASQPASEARRFGPVRRRHQGRNRGGRRDHAAPQRNPARASRRQGSLEGVATEGPPPPSGRNTDGRGVEGAGGRGQERGGGPEQGTHDRTGVSDAGQSRAALGREGGGCPPIGGCGLPVRAGSPNTAATLCHTPADEARTAAHRGRRQTDATGRERGGTARGAYQHAQADAAKPAEDERASWRLPPPVWGGERAAQAVGPETSEAWLDGPKKRGSTRRFTRPAAAAQPPTGARAQPGGESTGVAGGAETYMSLCAPSE